MNDTASRRAYLALRYRSPEAVRNLRLALDVGRTPAGLKRLCGGEFAGLLRDAIDHLAVNPGAGVVRWDGSGYTWRDDEGGPTP